jgi:hypothetical protein
MRPAADGEITQQIARHLEALMMNDDYESEKDVNSN